MCNSKTEKRAKSAKIAIKTACYLGLENDLE